MVATLDKSSAIREVQEEKTASYPRKTFVRVSEQELLERRPRKAGRGRQIFCFIATPKPALEPNTLLTQSLLHRQKKILPHSHLYMLSRYKIFTCKSMYCAFVFAFSGSNSCFYINYFLSHSLTGLQASDGLYFVSVLH